MRLSRVRLGYRLGVVTINVHVDGDLVVQQSADLSDLNAKLDEVLAQLTTIGESMSQLDETVDQAVSVLASQQATIADLSQQLLDALANDAADAATIAAKQEELDAVNADVAENVTKLQEAFPAPGGGDPEPEPEPAPDEG
jgi:chromosome segregation ATPase